MNKLKSKYLCFTLCVISALAGCGGGGGGGSSSSASSNTGDAASPTPTVTSTRSIPTASAIAANLRMLTTPAGTTCDGVVNQDALGGNVMSIAQPINAAAWGCLIVNSSDGQPVYDGNQSLRFEVRKGDCNSNAGFNDCTNDRSRFEINETNLPASTEGKIITYETRLYIPSQERIRPLGAAGNPSSNPLSLTQINFINSAGDYGTIAFLEVDENNNLFIQTHVGLTFNVLNRYPVYTNPFDKWIKIKYIVKSTAGADGYIKVYVDDVLKVDETRQTLPNVNSDNMLKFGIYNSFISTATEPYLTQVVYFDGIKKTVQ